MMNFSRVWNIGVDATLDVAKTMAMFYLMKMAVGSVKNPPPFLRPFFVIVENA